VPVARWASRIGVPLRNAASSDSRLRSLVSGTIHHTTGKIMTPTTAKTMKPVPIPASATKLGNVSEMTKADSQLNKVAIAIATPRMASGKISASITHSTGPQVAEKVFVNTTNAAAAMTNSVVELTGSSSTAAPTANKLVDMPTRPASRTGFRPRRSTTLDRMTSAIVPMFTSPLRKPNNNAVVSDTPKLVRMVGA
jgi:hypothetical protein